MNPSLLSTVVKGCPKKREHDSVQRNQIPSASKDDSGPPPNVALLNPALPQSVSCRHGLKALSRKGDIKKTEAQKLPRFLVCLFACFFSVEMTQNCASGYSCVHTEALNGVTGCHGPPRIRLALQSPALTDHLSQQWPGLFRERQGQTSPCPGTELTSPTHLTADTSGK